MGSIPIVLSISFLSIFTNLIVLDINQSVFPVAIIRGPLYIFFYILVFVQIIAIVYQSVTTSRVLKGIEKLQFRYFILGAILMMTAITITNVILPNLGITYFVRLPGMFSVIFTSFCTFAIIRHHLFSIKTIIIKVIQTVLLGLLFLGVVLTLRIFKDSVLRVSQFSYEAIFLDTFMSILIAIITPRFLEFVDKKLNALIKPEIYFLANLSKKIESGISLDLKKEEIRSLIIDKLDESFVYSRIFIVENVNNKLEVYPSDINLQVNLDKEDLNIDKTLFLDDLNNQLKARESLVKNGISIIGKISPTQYILFTTKTNHEAYTATEMEIIEEVIENLTKIYLKVNSYQEIKNFNISLQEKVTEATSELQLKNQALQEQLRKEKDMMDILGHELRTPLSIARNAVLMMDTTIQKLEKEDQKSQLTHLIEKAKENIRREVKILETVLSSTRIENNRLQINFEKVDLKDVINDSIEGNIVDARNKKLVLTSELPDENIYILGGREQVQEIVDNLISNAIKYTKEGSILVKLQKSESFGQISIIDTGEGIAKEEIPNLGKKFYRIHSHLDNVSPSDKLNIIRPGGTGIGLYVVFNLIRMMNSKIEIDSQVGKGSTFTVNFPLYLEQDIKTS
ncbi:MAG: ATP-binding protein [Rickettsiaceae bacterium]|nr:ATP-binding protein [Rickettsiaceae bacterium]